MQQSHPLYKKYLERVKINTDTNTTITGSSALVSIKKSAHPYLRLAHHHKQRPQQHSHHSRNCPEVSAASNTSIVSTSRLVKPTATILDIPPSTVLQTFIKNSSLISSSVGTIVANAFSSTQASNRFLTLSNNTATTTTTTSLAIKDNNAITFENNNDITNQQDVKTHNESFQNKSCNALEEDAATAYMEAKNDLNFNDKVSINNSILSKNEPDVDTIKMFVGQIPKSWDESKLRFLFEPYGRVHTLNVLRDKATMASRGCCFVTYYTRKAALKAQDALHDIKTLDGMHHPIQMKPADSENRNERKLFVGMLNKKYNEVDVRQLLTGHGTIEECTVLRDQNGHSKGCAFVTFDTKQHAIAAIKALHHSRTMEGCSAPLVVKFADTQKEKDQKKLHQLGICSLTNTANVLSTFSGSQSVASTLNNPIPLVGAASYSNPNMSALMAPTLNAASTTTALISNSSGVPVTSTMSLSAANHQFHISPYITSTDALLASAPSAAAAQLQMYQKLQAFRLPPHYIQGLNLPPCNDAIAATLSFTPQAHNNNVSNSILLVNPLSIQNLELTSFNNGNIPAQTATAVRTHPQEETHTTPLAAMSGPSALPAHFLHSSALLPYPDAALLSPCGPTLNSLTNGAAYTTTSVSAAAGQAAGVAGKQIEGPEGSNLFIYHLPQEFSDTDLASTFLPFGNVLSAKVFIDKQTNLSKCFGFVSYDNPHSASMAIQAMHGFQIGTKRLKVQLKRSKYAAKPY